MKKDKELNKKLKEKYFDIAKEHSNINFILVDKIIPFVKNHPLNSSGIYLSQVAKEFNISQGLANTYCIKYIVPTGRISIHKHGKAVRFPVVIDYEGDKLKKKVDEVLNESSGLVIDFFPNIQRN